MSTRLSNFELLRIVAMLLILLLHCNYAVIGPVTQTEISHGAQDSVLRIFCEQLCLCGVNLFILISGWFGIKFKLKGILNILFQVIFLALIIYTLAYILGIPIPHKEALRALYFGAYYWFVPAYLVMYVMSPALNAFIRDSDYRTIRNTLAAFFALEFLLGWLVDWASFDFGYSGISFIGLYMLARFLNKYRTKIILFNWKASYHVLIYLILTILPTLITYTTVKYLNYGFTQLSYSSPFVIGASVALLILFSRWQFKSNLINTIGASTFAMYLIQLNPVVWPYWQTKMSNLYIVEGGGSYAALCIIICLLFSFCCVIIDKLRIVVWRYLTIHKKCSD